jgi:hypothetical protein
LVPKNPEITGQGDRRFRKFRDRILIGQAFGRILCREQPRQFLVLEANQDDVEVLLLQGRKLGPKQRLIPPRVQRELVVGEDVGALLRIREVIQDDHRHFCELKLPRGEKATMAGQDARLGVHQDRVVETESSDAGGDLGNLGV